MFALATLQERAWCHSKRHDRRGYSVLNTFHNKVSQRSQISYHELHKRIDFVIIMALNKPKRNESQLRVGICRTSLSFLSVVIDSSNVLLGCSRLRQHRQIVSSKANLHKKRQACKRNKAKPRTITITGQSSSKEGAKGISWRDCWPRGKKIFPNA